MFALSYPNQPYHDSYLGKQNKGNTVFEFLVLRLVMPSIHSQQGPDASAENRQPDQCCLRYAPLGALGFPFVDTIQKERQDIDSGQVDERDM